MKLKYVTLTLVMLFAALAGYSQAPCVPDVSFTEPGLYPNDTLLPCVERSVYYEQAIQFKNFDVIDGTPLGFPGLYTVISTVINSIDHVPTGLSTQCDDANCTYAGNANGCILVTGTTNDPAGDYYLGISATVTVASPFGPIPFQADSQTLADAGLTYKLTVIDNGAICPNTSAPCVTQDIQLNSGWNMVSSYIQPDDPDMLNLISSIASEVLLIKNGPGQATIPSLAINAIGNWDVTEGYKIKMVSDAILSIGCEPVDPLLAPLNLPAGWSIISYLRSSPLPITTALNSITADIIIVKNNQGQAYIPAVGVDNVGDMIPGQGYKIKLSSGVTLTYPGN